MQSTQHTQSQTIYRPGSLHFIFTFTPQIMSHYSLASHLFNEVFLKFQCQSPWADTPRHIVGTVICAFEPSFGPKPETLESFEMQSWSLIFVHAVLNVHLSCSISWVRVCVTAKGLSEISVSATLVPSVPFPRGRAPCCREGKRDCGGGTCYEAGSQKAALCSKQGQTSLMGEGKKKKGNDLPFCAKHCPLQMQSRSNTPPLSTACG